MENRLIRNSIRSALLLGAATLASAAFASPTYNSNPTTPPSKTSPTDNSAMTGNTNVTSDNDLTRQVKSRLASMNDLQDANINVSTMEGKVTLTGTVSSKDQEKSAKAAAEAIPGVKKVDDDLSVSKPPKAGH
jgi:hyperosmotically inducible protein